MEGRRRDDGMAIRKGPWMAEEDEILMDYVNKYGPRDWSAIRSKGLLPRTGKSCRLRWVNKLKPDLKTGCKFSAEEERVVIDLQAQFGNKWARIATYLPGRTDNDVKNFWSTRQKRLARILQTSSPPKSNKNHSKLPVFHCESQALEVAAASDEQSTAHPRRLLLMIRTAVNQSLDPVRLYTIVTGLITFCHVTVGSLSCTGAAALCMAGGGMVDRDWSTHRHRRSKPSDDPDSSKSMVLDDSALCSMPFQEESSNGQCGEPMYSLGNSDVIKMVPLPDLINPNLLNLETNLQAPDEFIHLDKKPCLDPSLQFPRTHFPQQPLDIPPLSWSHDLTTGFIDTSFLDIYRDTSEKDLQFPFELTFTPLDVNQHCTKRRDNDLTTPDSFFHDFPVDMFDHLEPLPNSSE